MITLKTLPQATAQEVYNQVKEHLLGQDCRSEDEERGSCAYRGKNGLKCAAGCLIADDEYKSEMEGRSWNADIFPDPHRRLIVSLQNVHDGIEPQFWKEKLIVIALDYNLQP